MEDCFGRFAKGSLGMRFLSKTDVRLWTTTGTAEVRGSDSEGSLKATGVRAQRLLTVHNPSQAKILEFGKELGHFDSA